MYTKIRKWGLDSQNSSWSSAKRSKIRKWGLIGILWKIKVQKWAPKKRHRHCDGSKTVLWRIKVQKWAPKKRREHCDGSKTGLKMYFQAQNKKVRVSGSTENKFPMAAVKVFKKVRVPSLIFCVFLFKNLGVALTSLALFSSICSICSHKQFAKKHWILHGWHAQISNLQKNNLRKDDTHKSRSVNNFCLRPKALGLRP